MTDKKGRKELSEQELASAVGGFSLDPEEDPDCGGITSRGEIPPSPSGEGKTDATSFDPTSGFYPVAIVR